MSRTTLTTKTQRRLIGRIADNLPDDLLEEDALCWIDHSAELQEGLRSLLIRSTNWLDRLIQAENDAHRVFFGQTFDLTQFEKALEYFGEDRVSQWATLGLEPHFLPNWEFSADTKVRGWKVKPESWFWQQVAAGIIKRRNVAGELETVKEVGLDGIAVLIDPRCKPAYDGGRQMFANDECFLGGAIETLRTEGKIARYDYGQQSSRFGISSREWDEQLRPTLENRPEFEGVSWRLELAIEANTFPQIYKRMSRRKDGQTDTWVWYEEFFGGDACRLHGGYSGDGGLAGVSYDVVDDHWACRAVRPVGVLDAWSV